MVVTGRISAYAGRSKIQLIADHVEDAGTGDLLRRLEELKRRLGAEGLFDSARKRPLPFPPRCIGVVTSLRGAAIRDFVRTVRSRYPGRILIVDSLVKGEGAAARIAEGIESLNRIPEVDVIVIGRGGGSLEDMWAFNEEILVRAVAASRVPVVSAVGHEIDHVLTDEAADLRAATPTAAGQLVVPSLAELLQQLALLRDRGRIAIRNCLDTAGQRADEASDRLRNTSFRLFDRHRSALDSLGARLRARDPRLALAERQRLHRMVSDRLRALGTRLLEPHRSALGRFELRLAPLDPFAPLGRGYALVRTSDGGIVRGHDQVGVGDRLDVRLGVGALDCEVLGTRPI